MSMPKVAVMLPTFKRVKLKKKVKFQKGNVAKIVTAAGKKILIPANQVMVCTDAYCQYVMPQKKAIKGDFEYDAKKGFFICKDTGARVNPAVLMEGIDKPPLTAKQKKANKKKAAAMKAAREGKSGKKAKKKKKKK